MRYPTKSNPQKCHHKKSLSLCQPEISVLANYNETDEQRTKTIVWNMNKPSDPKSKRFASSSISEEFE